MFLVNPLIVVNPSKTMLVCLFVNETVIWPELFLHVYSGMVLSCIILFVLMETELFLIVESSLLATARLIMSAREFQDCKIYDEL